MVNFDGGVGGGPFSFSRTMPSKYEAPSSNSVGPLRSFWTLDWLITCAASPGLVRSKEQLLESAKMKAQMMVDKRKDIIEWRKDLDITKKPNNKKTLTDKHKIDLLDLLDECYASHDHMEHLSLNLLDEFLGDKPVKYKNINLHKLLSSLLDTCPEDCKPRKELEDHLILTCRLRSEAVDHSDPYMEVKWLELEWSGSMLSSLKNLRRSKSSMAVFNQMVAGILEGIAIRKNTFKYSLGSEAIRKQLEETLRNMEAASRPEGVRARQSLPRSTLILSRWRCRRMCKRMKKSQKTNTYWKPFVLLGMQSWRWKEIG